MSRGTDGLVILGASGGLGSALISAAMDRCAAGYYFDRYSNARSNVRICDLANTDEIRSTLDLLPYSDCNEWRLFVAAGVYQGRLDDDAAAGWREIQESLAINLIGIVHFATEFARRIALVGKRGRIVITTSAAARVGSRDIGYGVAKAGLEGLVRSLSKRYASRQISVIGLAPGIFDSSMSQAQDPTRRLEAIAATHSGRQAQIDEVMRCAYFAVFDAPDALTGTFISPNGGQV